MSGPGGVGKSHVIRLIHSDTIKLLRLSGCIEPGEVTAPTGIAAFNIGGMTLHSAFLLNIGRFGYQPLNSEKLNTLRMKLSHLTLLVISILALGDLYQLPPVGQPAVFDTVTDAYAKLYASGSLWQEEFSMIELSEVMRQRGDTSFVEILGRVRTASCTSKDINVLRSRVITRDDPNYPVNALHVYRINVDVDKRNSEMLNNLASEDQQVAIKSLDSISGHTAHMNLFKLSEKRTETGGLHSTLKLAVGARVMLTANVDESDGLVNGARGTVVEFVRNGDVIVKILVLFDNPNVGTSAMQSNRSTQYNNPCL